MLTIQYLWLALNEQGKRICLAAIYTRSTYLVCNPLLFPSYFFLKFFG